MVDLPVDQLMGKMLLPSNTNFGQFLLWEGMMV